SKRDWSSDVCSSDLPVNRRYPGFSTNDAQQSSKGLLSVFKWIFKCSLSKSSFSEGTDTGFSGKLGASTVRLGVLPLTKRNQLAFVHSAFLIPVSRPSVQFIEGFNGRPHK